MRTLRRGTALACTLLAACSVPEPDLPASYRALEVPFDRLDDPAARARGRDLYLETCALCHGVRGDGHGPRAGSLASPPADLTRLAARGRAEPRFLFYRLREGVPGTDMPSWKALDEDQIWDLVTWVRSLSER